MHYTANGGHLLGATDRGYTGHEHLDHLGLVHMNGRIYDASLGRFMSTDPFIAQPHNLQNHNRYAYVNNNPLSYTDPSGYIFKWLGRQVKKVFKNKLFRAAATIAVAYYTGGLVEGWLVNSGATGFATAAGLTSAGKAAVGVASGFASGFVGSGGDLKSALHAGLTGGAFGFAGTVGAASDPSRYFAHAAAGCLSSAIGGGDCDQGAVSALAGKYVSNNTPLSWGGSTGLAAATVAGGTVSILSGGKFANGAVTAAFGYLYNEALSNFESAQSADELLASEYPMEVAMATDPSKMGLGGAGAPGVRYGGATVSGIRVTGHSVQQKINRQVRSVDELDALKNPLLVKPVKVDSLGRPSQRYIGGKAEVAVNPETGRIVSVNPTSTKKAERLSGQGE